MNKINVSVVFNASKLNDVIITRLIRLWPVGFKYIIQTESDFLFNKKIKDANVSILKKDAVYEYLKNNEDDWVIFSNDDSSISIPDINFINLNKNDNSVSIVTFGEMNEYDIPYSPESTYTPDLFLGSVVIPTNYLNLIDIESLVNSNRWLGHDIALQCIKNNIDYNLIPFYDFIMPSPNFIKGRHIIKNRKLAPDILRRSSIALANVKHFESWIIKNTEIIDMINALPSVTTSKDVDLSNKNAIDKHLSSLTRFLYKNAKSVKTPSPKNNKVSLENKKVAIFKIDSIGDFIISTSIIESILNSKPKEVTLITTSLIASLYKNDRRFTNVIGFDEARKISISCYDTISMLEDELSTLDDRINNYDIAVFPRYYPDFSSGHHLAILNGIPVRIGIKNKHHNEGLYLNPMYECMLTHCCSPRHEQHEVEKINALTAVMSLSEPSKHLFIPRTFDLDYNYQYLDEFKYVVIGAGAMNPNRRYPAEKIREFLNLMKKDSRTMFMKCVIIGGEDITGFDIEKNSDTINLIGKLTLAQSANIISRAIAYVGNDTGTMHLAAALNIPCIVISMHPKTADLWHVNSPMRFGPWGVKSLILQPNRPIEEQCKDGCIAHTPHCISEIDAEDVFNSLINIIKEE